MNTRSVTAALGTFGLGLLLAWPVPARAQDEPPPPTSDQGVEVLTRGPIHEAYAEPVDSRPPPAPIIPKQPPDPIEEVPSDMKPEGDNVVWIPGYWGWDDGRSDFIWVSGFWRVPPPDRQWVPGHWDQVDGGWQWTPGFWAQANQTDVQYLPPPPPSVDAGASTPAPQPDAVYTPGTWVYEQTRYVWRPGFWLTPRPGWMWVPAHYIWTPVGYVFVDGYWDYPLADRGLLFAPVAIDLQVVRRGWYYRPTYAVYTDFLTAALFVRPAWGCYYFGDYFDPAYRRFGFTPWIDYRFGRTYDPLFAYDVWLHRDNPDWGRQLRSIYVGRFNGTIPRPPVTLVQQNTVIERTTNKSVVRYLTAAAPLTSYRSTTVKLTRVAPAQQQHFREVAQAFHQASVQRSRTEARLLAQGPAPTRPTERARTARIEVPRAAVTTGGKSARTPPPPPQHPAHVQRTLPKHEPPPAPQVHKPLPPSERPRATEERTRTGERPPSRPAERPAPRQTEPKPPERKPPERPAPRPPERPAQKPPERPAPPPSSKPPEKPAPKPPAQKPPENKKDKG
jgi:hypothetical protein